MAGEWLYLEPHGQLHPLTRTAGTALVTSTVQEWVYPGDRVGPIEYPGMDQYKEGQGQYKA